MVRCEGCEREVAEQDTGMGYNFGGRPEYLCLKCCPPGSAETIIAAIKTFMGRLPPSSSAPEGKDNG